MSRDTGVVVFLATPKPACQFLSTFGQKINLKQAGVLFLPTPCFEKIHSVFSVRTKKHTSERKKHTPVFSVITTLRVSLSKIEIFGPRYFLDLPSQHVSERVVFGPFAVTRGRKLLETFSDLQIFSVPLFMTKRFHGRGHGRVCGCLRTVSWTRTCQDSLFMHAHASLHDYARACRRKRDCASTLARHVTSSTFSAWSSVFTNDCRVYTDTGAW